MNTLLFFIYVPMYIIIRSASPLKEILSRPPENSANINSVALSTR
jgi:hypothetical protein